MEKSNSDKQYTKSKKLKSLHIASRKSEISYKDKNLRIVGTEEGKEIQVKDTENIFNKIKEENFLYLMK